MWPRSSTPEDLELLSVEDEVGGSRIEDPLDGLASGELDEAVAGVAVDFGVNNVAETSKEGFKLAPEPKIRKMNKVKGAWMRNTHNFVLASRPGA